jgi:hypothetical protein
MTSVRRIAHVSLTLAGAAASLALLSSIVTIDQVPGWLLVPLLGLSILTMRRPDLGLAVVAGAIPIASWLARGWNLHVAWAQVLVIAAAAGWFLSELRRPPRTRDDLDAPVLLSMVVIAASFLVYEAVLNWRLTGSPFSLGQTGMFSEFFLTKRNGDALEAAARLLECLFLFRVASVTAERKDDFLPRLTALVVAGATIAAALNVWVVWAGARRLDAPIAAFLHYLATIRVSSLIPDLNAAGSFFVLALFAALGLASEPRRRIWILPAALIALSLWLTGSRAALLAAVLAAALPLGRMLRQRIPRHALTAAAVAAIVVVGGATVAGYYLKRGSQPSSFTALRIRWELAKTSARMTESAPVFGVGIGQFYESSGEFSSPELLQMFPRAASENAHNNFLQILAELGVVGFASILWVLLRAASRVKASLRSTNSSALRWGIATGLVAFVLTWLAGHPLLLDEPAFTFWIVLGAAAGAARTTAPMPLRTRNLAIVAMLVVLLFVPLRARREMASANMEHVGFGLSRWQTDPSGIRYRSSTGHSTVFVPANARVVRIPLHIVGTTSPLHVRLRLDGRPADTVVVPPDRWFDLRFSLNETTATPRFRRLDLEVLDPNPDRNDILMIGKVEPH